MENKKKNNDGDRLDRKIFIGMGTACLIGLFVLLLLFQALTTCGCEVYDESIRTSIAATNNAVYTLLAQTDVAATEQFMLTSTALP